MIVLDESTSSNQSEQSESTAPSFEQIQLQCMEQIITQIGQRLLQGDLDLLKTNIQSLYRLYGSNVTSYTALKNQISKQNQSVDESLVTQFSKQWRDDPVRFAHEALSIELYKHQQQVVKSDKRTTILIAGRGAGKSVAARVTAIHRAICCEGHTVLVVSSGQRMSSDFGEKLLDLIRESSARDLTRSISQEQVTFKNGSCIKFLPANPDTIRGYHPKTSDKQAGVTIILDEACFMEQGNEIRKAVEYALITTSKEEGRLVIVSSPTTLSSWVHDYVKLGADPNSDVAVFQCGSAANPNITQEEIEHLRRTKNDLEFRAEVLGEWVDGAFTLFGGLIEDNRVDDPKPLPDEAHLSLGADLALSYDASHDRSVLAVIAKWWPDETTPDSEPRYRLVDLEYFDQSSDKLLRETVKRLVKDHGITSASIENYQGKSLAEYTQSLGVETEIVAPTTGAQQMIFHEMHRLLRQKQLELPNTLPDLFFDELKSFEYRRQPNGHVVFGHPTTGGKHDDTVYAAAWALHATNRENASVGLNETPILPMLTFISK